MQGGAGAAAGRLPRQRAHANGRAGGRRARRDRWLLCRCVIRQPQTVLGASDRACHRLVWQPSTPLLSHTRHAFQAPLRRRPVSDEDLADGIASHHLSLTLTRVDPPPPQHNVSTGSPAPAPVSDEDLADAIAWATRHTGGVSLRAAALFARFFATAAAAE